MFSDLHHSIPTIDPISASFLNMLYIFLDYLLLVKIIDFVKAMPDHCNNSIAFGSLVKCVTQFDEEKQGEVIAYDKKTKMLLLSKCKYEAIIIQTTSNQWLKLFFNP